MDQQMQQCFQGIKQELVENNGNLARSLLLPAANVLNETFFQHNNYDSSDSGSVATKTKHANESPEARARRLARNAQRMREKRANESYEEYKARLAKNAESNRRKRQMENDVERAMRQVKDAARQRLRRAMESPEQRTARLAKLAERMRMVRANESQEQRNERLKRSAARARERLSRESSEERRDRLQKRAEYARKMRSVNTSEKGDSSVKPKTEKITVPASKIISGSSNQNSTTGSNAGSTANNPPNSHLSQHHSSYPNAHQPPNVPSNSAPAQDYTQSNNLVTLNNVKNDQFNQFPLNQNPLFIDLRSGGYLNVPTYPNPTLNMFPDGLQTPVPPHLQNYVHSLSLPIHPTQLTMLPNSTSFTTTTSSSSDHPTHHPASVIQVTPNPNNYPNSFLGQHHPPFQPQHHPPNSQLHSLQQAVASHQHNFSNHRPPNSNQVPPNRATTPDSSSNDSTKEERIRERARKVFPISDHDNSGVAEEMRDEAERQKLMSELLEKQINIILACPKRSRGRPSKGRESDNERKERLRKMAEGRRMKRANESSEQRQIRLHNLTERARQKREFVKATETEDERKERLARQAEYARRRRLKEQTPEAKYKSDARAKELYAKLHIKKSPDDRVANILSAVKLRIPNLALRDANLKTNSIISNLFEPIIEMQTTI